MSPVADSITRQNERARDRAQRAGQATYLRQIVDDWPACVVCAAPIRCRAGEGGYYRRCGCPGVRWWCSTDGWHRNTDDPIQAAGMLDATSGGGGDV